MTHSSRIQAVKPARRTLALATLLGAMGLTILVFPFRSSWWGALLLAMTEAAVVGGVADWFAVTALFRRPMGLPIPHTALIARNWELLARRVGDMVGSRILTKTYVQHEISQVDLSGLLRTLATRVSKDDILRVTSLAAAWLADRLSNEATEGVVARLRRALSDRPLAPAMAMALELADQHGWDDRAVETLARALAGAMDSPGIRSTVNDVIDDALDRYRRSLGRGARLVAFAAGAFGLIDPDRIIRGLREGAMQIANDAAHPVRREISRVLSALPDRLRHDADLAARVELFKVQFLASAPVDALLRDAADDLSRWLADDLRAERSESVQWLAARLDEGRAALASDAELRRAIDAWAKECATQLVDQNHEQISAFIEKGVRTLGSDGAVRLIEEHAGDDLQYIRVNGTVVGGLAGGVLHLVIMTLQRFGW